MSSTDRPQYHRVDEFSRLEGWRVNPCPVVVTRVVEVGQRMSILYNQYVQNTVIFATRLHRKSLRCSKRRTLCLGMTLVTEATTSSRRMIRFIIRYSGCCSSRGTHLENPHGISTTGHAIQVAHRKNNAVALVNQPV